MYERIVAGTDLSKTAQVATDRAAMLAKALGGQLVLVHAGTDPGESLAELAERYGADVVVQAGPPAEVLVSVAEERNADLLVVGSVGMSGTRRFLLGSVPNKVSHHSAMDVLIVKTDPPPHTIDRYDKIMVGTDGSPTATKAVEMAAALSKRLDVKPMIVCVYEPPTEEEMARLKADPNDPTLQWRTPKDVASVPAEFRWRIAGASHAEDVLERAADRASAAGVDPEVRAVAGHPAETMITIADEEEFDLIVVGNVGMSGAKRFMLGNVPHRISHHAPTDVLILRTS